MPRRTVLLTGALLFAGSRIASPDTATLVSTRDNTLIEDATGALSNGAGPTMFAGRTNQLSSSVRRAVLRFDVAGAVPPGSTILGVALTLNMSQAATPSNQSIELRRLAADWGEGTSDAGTAGGGGAPSTPGDATWRHRFFPGTPWASPGGDFTGSVKAAIAVGFEGPYTWGPTPGMIADVQGWLDNPASNFGWGMIGNENSRGTAKRFDTRENLDPLARPMLKIDYTPPGTPATVATWGKIKAQYR